MKKLLLTVFLLVICAGISHAYPVCNRQLFGPVDGYIQLTTEDDKPDQRATIYRSEMSIWRDVCLDNISVVPY